MTDQSKIASDTQDCFGRKAKRDWLKRYRDCQRGKEYYLEEVQRIKTYVRKLTRVLTGMPSGNLKETPESKWARAIDQMDETADRLLDLASKEKQIINDITSAIDHLKSSKERAVLTGKYIRGKTFIQIMMDLECSERSVYNLHASALDHLQVPEVYCKRSLVPKQKGVGYVWGYSESKELDIEE